MTEKSYGNPRQAVIDEPVAIHVEEIVTKGYTCLTDMLNEDQLREYREAIDGIYEGQVQKFGLDQLAAINELDVCRAPVLYDLKFLLLANHPSVSAICKSLLGEWVILNQQNAVINRPGVMHHQTSWHRDLPYQNFVSTQPLALSVLWMIDEFSQETGGTQVVPYTHRMEVLPSKSYINSNKVSLSGRPGSVVIFDSMLFHCAGTNSSSLPRRAVNNVLTRPILKQFCDFPKALGEHKDLSPDDAQLLGYTSQVPVDDVAWRQARIERKTGSSFREGV